MSETKGEGPVLIHIDEAPDAQAAPTAQTEARDAPLNPADAPPVPDIGPAGPEATGRAMQTVAKLGARGTSRLAAWFWSLLISLTGVIVSLAAVNYATALVERSPLLGMVVTALMVAFLAVLVMIAIKELAGFARLRRVDSLHRAADAALAERDVKAARGVAEKLSRLYAGREEMRWGRETLRERADEQFDAEAVLGLAETALLRPLDAAARAEVEAAARQVATVTALVPLALADVAAAMTANIRMIRRVAEIYGGRSGTLGAWRLTRAVLTHLVATGAVAVGDDMLEPIIGGGLLGKLSRRFGEGMVNGALTARVGVAAMEVCRPLPFRVESRPKVPSLVKRALAGFVKS